MGYPTKVQLIKRKESEQRYINSPSAVARDMEFDRTQALSALVELNFRDEKTVLGVGEAQVRTQAAVETVPCFVVVAYAFLLLAAADVGQGRIGLPVPKWRRMQPGERDSTPRLIGALRSQLWGRAIAKVQGPASVTGVGLFFLP